VKRAGDQCAIGLDDNRRRREEPVRRIVDSDDRGIRAGVDDEIALAIDNLMFAVGECRSATEPGGGIVYAQLARDVVTSRVLADRQIEHESRTVCDR
jgi:hypothetical protein